jgi:hypothetical protein
MAAPPKPTKEKLLKMIDELENNPEDKASILGDAGITLIGAGLGIAASSIVASTVGATSIFGITTMAGWLGVTAVAATPIGWIIGCATAAGAAAYGVSRLIRSGGLAEGRKKELLQQYKEDAKKMEMKENADNIVDSDKTVFIISIRDLIDKDVISPDDAANLIKNVEQGTISISHAYSLLENLLNEKNDLHS